MKNLFFFLLLAVPFLFTACDEDDTTDPNIVIVEPGDGAAVMATGMLRAYVQFSDNESLSSASVMLTPNDGGDALVNINAQPSGTDFTVDETIEVPETATVGEYTMTVSATDGAGNSKTLTRLVNITEAPPAECAPTADCMVDGQLTILVRAPESTMGEDVFIVGSFQGWDPSNPDNVLVKNPDVDNCYCVSVPFEAGDGTEFKFVRGGGWDTVEKDADCEEVSNRTYDEATDVLVIDIAKWADQDCQ